MSLYSREEFAKRGATPLPAASVILVRDGDEGMELFLMRRHRLQSFMAGAYVFPGGGMDEGDRDRGLVSRCSGMVPERAAGALGEPQTPGDYAFGFFICALRELFEEAGVLLAAGDNGEILDFSDPEAASAFDGYRKAIYQGGLTLGKLAEKGRLTYALDTLVPYARWITPEVEPKRFDARFFVARLPQGQRSEHDNVELVDSLSDHPGRSAR